MAYALLFTSVLGLLGHFVSWQQGPAIAVAACSFYLMATAPLAGFLFALNRRRSSALLAILITVAGLVIQVPRFRGAAVPKDASAIVVMTANLRLGEADAGALVASVRSHHVDVLMLEEFTDSAGARLRSAGLDSVLPNTISKIRSGAAGVGIWSRFPLADTKIRQGMQFASVSARLLVGPNGPSPTVLAVHLPGPWPDSSTGWLADMRRLPAVLSGVAAEADEHGSTVIVGGDFNATFDNAQFRNLLHGGYRDAAQRSGAGLVPTYPAASFIPPIVGIDHVLIRNASAGHCGTVAIRGSDHRALIVQVGLKAH